MKNNSQIRSVVLTCSHLKIDRLSASLAIKINDNNVSVLRPSSGYPDWHQKGFFYSTILHLFVQYFLRNSSRQTVQAVETRRPQSKVKMCRVFLSQQLDRRWFLKNTHLKIWRKKHIEAASVTSTATSHTHKKMLFIYNVYVFLV